MLLLLAAACVPPHALVPVAAEINPHNPFSALVTGAWDRDLVVWVEHGEGRATPAVEVRAGEVAEVLVLGLHAGRRHPLTVVTDDGERTWAQGTSVRTEPLPEDWPTCTADAEPDPAAAEVVCTNGSRGTPVYHCVDLAGAPVWTLVHPHGAHMRAVTALSDGGWAAVSQDRSALAVFDPAGALVEEVTALDLAGQTRFEHDFIDMHEVIELAGGPWAGALAVLTVTADLVEDRQTVLGGGIVVLDREGEVRWDWSAHGPLGDGVPMDPALDYARRPSEDDDWLHPNGLVHELDADGGQVFWMSSRNQSWLIAVEVATDAVRWRLGDGGDLALVADLDDPGTPLDPGGWMRWQHSPERLWRDGDRAEVILFDNGTEGRSRVLGFALDEAALLAAPTVSLEVDYAAEAGDADLLAGGDRLLVMGHGPEIEIRAFPEVEEVRWRWTCDAAGGLYRARWYPSLYETTWRYE